MLLQGGFRQGHLTELVGPSSSYKTQVGIHLISDLSCLDAVIYASEFVEISHPLSVNECLLLFRSAYKLPQLLQESVEFYS